MMKKKEGKTEMRNSRKRGTDEKTDETNVEMGT